MMVLAREHYVTDFLTITETEYPRLESRCWGNHDSLIRWHLLGTSDSFKYYIPNSYFPQVNSLLEVGICCYCLRLRLINQGQINAFVGYLM